MPMGVSVVYNQRDQATGEAFVEFSNEVDLSRYVAAVTSSTFAPQHWHTHVPVRARMCAPCTRKPLLA